MVNLTDEEFLDIFDTVNELSSMFMFDIQTMPSACKDEVIKIAREDLEKLYNKLREHCAGVHAGPGSGGVP